MMWISVNTQTVIVITRTMADKVTSMVINQLMRKKMNRVDFHAHILPGVDHGSKDLDTSLKQLQAAKKAGVVTVVTTPHFYSWRQDLTTFLPLREKAFDLMQGYARQVNMQLISAAEVTLSMDLAKLVGLEQLCVGTTNYILI